MLQIASVGYYINREMLMYAVKDFFVLFFILYVRLSVNRCSMCRLYTRMRHLADSKAEKIFFFSFLFLSFAFSFFLFSFFFFLCPFLLKGVVMCVSSTLLPHTTHDLVCACMFMWAFLRPLYMFITVNDQMKILFFYLYLNIQVRKKGKEAVN